MSRFRIATVPGKFAFRCEPIVDASQWTKIGAGAGGVSYGLVRGSAVTSRTLGQPGAVYGEDLHAMIRWCEGEFGSRNRVLDSSGRWSFKYGRKIFLCGPGIHCELPQEGTFAFDSATDATLFRLRWV